MHEEVSPEKCVCVQQCVYTVEAKVHTTDQKPSLCVCNWTLSALLGSNIMVLVGIQCAQALAHT